MKPKTQDNFLVAFIIGAAVFMLIDCLAVIFVMFSKWDRLALESPGNHCMSEAQGEIAFIAVFLVFGTGCMIALAVNSCSEMAKKYRSIAAPEESKIIKVSTFSGWPK